MRIGIDYISAFGTGGNGTYTRELTTALARKEGRDRFELYTYLHHIFPTRRYPDLSDRAVFRGVYMPSFPFPALTRWGERISGEIFRFRSRDLDVMHFTNPFFFTKGLAKKVRVVVSIHDLSFIKDRSWVKASTRELLMSILPDIFREAHALIAVSECTKREIIAYDASVSSKTFVVHEGANSAFGPVVPDAAFLAHYGIAQPYILTVGEIQPRKNLETILAAYAQLPGMLRSRYCLVLAGAPRDSTQLQRLGECIHALKLDEQVIVVGHVPAEDLVKLYGGASLFAFASFYEGFGLPILEAMACGVPVVTSNTTSLPEIGGDSCLYAPPEDVEGFMGQFAAVLSDEILQKAMRKKGLARAGLFSWDKAARETRAIYRNVTGALVQ
ncbi:MAG: glycosyltransferase family 1 protein [bacterium]|nr:glycosyltransferase family 1 protein [bacterium]